MGGRVFVGDMSDEKSVQLASKVVSEGFVYTVSAGQAGGCASLLVFVYRPCLSVQQSIAVKA